jgi:non-ribosomal peptide synthetase component E (peptide arylation enzyme)
MLTNGYPYARTNIHAHRWGRLAHTNPDVLALSEPHNKQAVSLTYKECETTILQAAAGLAALGLKRSESVSVCAEQGCVCELGSASLPVNLHILQCPRVTTLMGFLALCSQMPY